MPEIIIVAGPNGAGKTTFARQHLAHLGPTYTFVNADEIARELDEPRLSQVQRDLLAARHLLQRLDALTVARANFAVETTLAALSYLPKIERWKRDGFRVTLIFLRLASPDDAVNRVHRRVAAGGHGIPESTIRRRFSLGLENLEKYYKAAVDEWYIYESLEGSYRLAESWNET
jgi:predicted ABC-type ATPase